MRIILYNIVRKEFCLITMKKVITIEIALILIAYAFSPINAEAPFGSNYKVNESVIVNSTSFQYRQSAFATNTGEVFIVWNDERKGDEDIYFTNSLDNGNTFSTNERVNGEGPGEDHDSPSVAVDNESNIFVVWENESSDDIYFANSTDGGNTFSTSKMVNDVTGQLVLNPTITTDEADNIYVAWSDNRVGNDRYIFFANSTDKGNTFSANKQVNDGDSWDASFPSMVARDEGDVYITWNDRRNGDPDIFFAKSNDGGNTFSTNKKVNSDGGGVWQQSPSIAVNNTGVIYITWLDNRDGDGNIYICSSLNDGLTFPADRKVNDDIGSYWQGMPSIAVGDNDIIYIAWQDQREGNDDIYFAKSYDGSISFSVNKKVNDDSGNSKQQLPSLTVDEVGNIFITWIDWRNGEPDVYFTNSPDEGETFSPNRRVNDDVGDPKQHQSSIVMGGNGNIYVAWVDRRNGDPDIYFTYSEDSGDSFLPNKRVNDDKNMSDQYAPSIAVDDTGNIYIAWEDYRNDDMDIYFANSTDGGNTFSANKKVNDDIFNAFQYSPQIGADGDGLVYIVWEDSRNGRNDIYFTRSTDGGNTFSNNIKVNDDTGNDRQRSPSMTIDDTGFILIAWEDDRNGDYDIYFAKSIDGGNSFLPNIMVNDNVVGDHFDPSIAVDEAGTIYICWLDGRPPWLHSEIYFANSTNGGITFSISRNVIDDSSEADQDDPSIASGNAGSVYIVWRDERNADSDIFFTQSNDGGDTFSTNKRVNDDNPGADQYEPSIIVNETGIIFVFWTDERNVIGDIYFASTIYSLFSVQVTNITDTSATVTWKTNKPANSTVEYGLSTDYGSTIQNITMVTAHSIELTGLEPGRRYHFRVTSFNSSINYSISGDFNFTTKFPIELEPGWNVISLPLNQTETHLEEVLEDISGEFDAVQWFDVDDLIDPWEHYHIYKQPGQNDLTDINRFMGLWIHMKNATTLYVDGIAPDIGYINEVALVGGWNFVGYPSLIERTPPFDLPAGVDLVQWFNATSGLWESWDPGFYAPDNLLRMKPGQGFWIHYTGIPTEWSLTYVN